MTDDTDERGEEYVARQRGGDHLPECPCVGQNSDYIVCICDRLRACEARVQERWRQGDPLLHEQQRQWYASGYDAAVRDVTALDQKLQPYQRGYAAGLSAARDAVAALEPWPLVISSIDDHEPPIVQMWVGHADALAAIDALAARQAPCPRRNR